MEGETQNGDSHPALRLRQLGRRFPAFLGLRSRPALRDVDLDLPAGSSIGLIGPNGSGKSTLLRLAAGVDRPSTGSVAAFGIDLASRGAKSALARLAYLPDDSPFPRELHARAVLDLLGSLSGLQRRERRARADAMLARVGLEAAAGRALGTYSKGMLRRFGLAQAFLHDPELILLDEPTAGLDALGFVVLSELTAEARARGASIVVASHVLSDLHAHCERVAVLIEGRVVALGPLDEVLDVARSNAGDAQREPENTIVSGIDPGARAELELWVQERGGRTAPHGERVDLAELYRSLAPRGTQP